MLFGNLVLALSCVAVGFSNPILKRELPEAFTSGLEGIRSYLSETNALIEAFPKTGATRDQAQAISDKVAGIDKVERSSKSLEDSLENHTVSPEENADIEKTLMSFVPTVQDIINNLDPLRPAFDALGIQPHVVRDNIFAIQLNLGYYLVAQLQFGRTGVQGVSQETVDKFKGALLPLFDAPSQAWW